MELIYIGIFFALNLLTAAWVCLYVKSQKKIYRSLQEFKNELYIRTQFIPYVDKLIKHMDLIESRNNDRMCQMEIRLTNLMSQNSSDQTRATWELKEKLLLLEHQPSKRVGEEGRPRGRPRKER
jgi:hypothetical protein